MDTKNTATAFRALHRQGLFVMPNPWDLGSARLLQSLGFPAVATTSAGLAFAAGRPDGAIGWAPTRAHVQALVAGLELPVSVDLENGMADDAETLAAHYAELAALGAAGASIEDTRGAGAPGQFEVTGVAEAAERVRIAVQAAHARNADFVLTARAENFIVGRDDLADTIARLQAYQAAGADVLFAPGLRRLADVQTVLRHVDRPLNVLAGLPGSDFGVAELAAAGVRRVSVGGSLARAAFGALQRAAQEILQHGRFDYTAQALPGAELNALFGRFNP